jgi:hypothetical protein
VLRIELLESEADFAESLPLAQRMQNNPILNIGPRISENDKIVSSEFPVPRRSLSIAVPFSQACQDNDLLAAFYTWEVWQSRQRALTYDMRQEVEPLIQLVGSKSKIEFLKACKFRAGAEEYCCLSSQPLH